MIYILMFICSSFLLFASRCTKNKYLCKLLVIAALLLPSLLAALRSTEIGTDYTVYGTKFLDRAVSSDSLMDFLETQIAYSSTEHGYNLIIYLCSLVSDEYIFEMFVIQLITVTFIYLGLCKCEKRYGTPVWLAMLLYYLCQYNASLNIMRQSVAVAIAFYAFTFIWEERYAMYAIFMIMAFSVHTSTVLAISIFVLYKFLQSSTVRTEAQQLFRGCLIVMVIIGVIVFLTQIVTLLVNLGLVRSAYLSYLSGGKYSTLSEGNEISIVTLFIQALYLVAFTIYYRALNSRKMDALFFMMVSLAVLLINVLSPLFANYIFRMSYYFVPIQMVGLANITRVNTRKSRPLWIGLLILVVFYTWYRLIVQQGGHETFPYEFYWE